jgi:hypothetical protein
MGESERQAESKEVRPNERLDYLCGVAREIVLKTKKEENGQKEWENNKYEFTLKAVSLADSNDPLFALKLMAKNIPSGVRSTGKSQYSFNKQRGVTFEAPLGMMVSSGHTSDEDPVVRKVLGWIEPRLWDSQVLNGEEYPPTMRKQFEEIAGRLSLQYLYTIKDRPLIRESIDELVAGITDDRLSKETRRFIVGERKFHNLFLVHDDTFRSSLNRLIEEGVPQPWRDAVRDL